MKYLLLFIFLINTALADQVVYLPKGSTTTFDGFLIDEDKADKIRNQKLDLDAALKVNALLTDETIVLTNRLKNSQETEALLSKRLVEARDDSFIGKVGYFLGGAILTGFISYGVVKTLK